MLRELKLTLPRRNKDATPDCLVKKRSKHRISDDQYLSEAREALFSLALGFSASFFLSQLLVAFAIC